MPFIARLAIKPVRPFVRGPVPCAGGAVSLFRARAMPVAQATHAQRRIALRERHRHDGLSPSPGSAVA